MGKKNRYEQLIEHIFLTARKGAEEVVEFSRTQIEEAARELNISLPKNIGDVIYSFRYRASLPDSVASTAPKGKQWVILPAGRARYRFVAQKIIELRPNPALAETRIPDATPGLIALYALSDEQALLAKLRYNRLVDIFTRTTCYSLQNHLRSTVPYLGQVEIDEIYIGVDKRGSHYVIPVQAKGGRDNLSVVQIQQDMALCTTKFSDLLCRPIGAQFLSNNVIVLFEFQQSDDGVRIASEKHYRLVSPAEFDAAELENYRRLSLDE